MDKAILLGVIGLAYLIRVTIALFFGLAIKLSITGQFDKAVFFILWILLIRHIESSIVRHLDAFRRYLKKETNDE